MTDTFSPQKRRCDLSFGAKRPASKKAILYHDTRWCKPEHRDRELFAMLILEGMQAGVSWELILNKEDRFRAAFDDFDPQRVAAYDDAKVETLLQDAGIIRNRAKIRAAIENARAFLRVQQEFGSFDRYLWSFTDGRVVDHRLQSAAEMPAKDALSEAVSRDLKKRGFRFVGPTIVYSYLQAVGIVNDHAVDCDYR